MRDLDVRWLGRVPYADGVALQREMVEARRAEQMPDTLLLLEHPPVLTLGVRPGSRSHILATPGQLASAGVEVHDTGRGGDVTYHGPGQLVGYPIIDLRPDRCDVHAYVRDIEEVMIRVCGDYGVAAARLDGLTGTWVGGNKIGAIGVRISRWITSHGFAFNVNTNLSHFQLIVPCGIADHGVTSLERELGHPIPLDDVAGRVVSAFCEVFGRRTQSLVITAS